MKKLTLLFAIFFAQETFGQTARVIKFDELEKIIHSGSDQVQVINFWATWCGPCVKELPVFEKLSAEKKTNVKVTLINLDFADKLDKVNSFISRKNLKSTVLLLDEIDYNAWIDKVDESWGGAIPATLVINPKTGQRKFVEKELSDGELENLIAEVQ
jgi:thiol-disulfide isomerase/thioredoxin